MLMRWEDLEPGDVLEVNPEFIEGSDCSSRVSDKIKSGKLTLKKIVQGYYPENITLSFNEFFDYRISINKFSGAFFDDVTYDIPLFRIVELKNE